eukprot:TRINITY_DN792_c1_g2_i1.p1 TRINITY_DN792_c1_g2~~TRINITY_DN792_c1_g2_i1.p1  ORF type:complete len:1018 (+),score=155.61 TRINITY_DN792_c1_g2_i1:34-3087(+)
MASSEAFVRRRAVATDERSDASLSEATANYKQPTFKQTAALPQNAHFQFNRRVACAFIPCLLILLMFGGKPLLWVIIAGLVATLLLDYAEVKNGVFIGLWGSLVFAQGILLGTGIFYLERTFFNVLLLFNFGIIVGLTGVWISLQFIHEMELSLHVMKLAERVLFVASPFPISAILTWATTVFLGVANAPFYYMVYLGICLYIFVLPLKSSFATASQQGPPQTETFICGRFETIVQILSFLVIPTIFYAAIHHNTFLSGYWNICNMLITLFTPLIVLRAFSQKGALWWMSLPEDRMNSVKAAMLNLSVFVLVGCFEYRVVFTSYYHYISIPAPLNYVVVTVGMYSFAIAVLTHYMGLLGNMSIYVATLFVELSALAWSFVLGLPFLMFPLPLAGGYFLTTFYYHRRLKDYMIFILTATGCLLWFSRKTLWFIDYQFELVNWTVQTTSIILVLMFVLIAIGPGLLIAGDSASLLGCILAVHALGMSFFEQMFHTEGEDVYPSSLVLLTSGLGVYLSHKLEIQGRISKQMKWTLATIYLSKVSLLLGESEMAIPSVLLLALTICPSLYWRNSPQMTIPQGFFHFATIGIACFLTRHTFQQQLLSFIIGQTPNESMIFSFFIIVWALNSLPLSYWYFPHIQGAKRMNVILLLSGVCFAVLQPNVDILASITLRRSYSSLASTSDPSSWASWLLFIAIVMIFMGLTSFVPFTSSAIVRLLYSSLLGCFLGLYTCAAHLPNVHGLYVATIALFVLIANLIAFVQWPNVTVGKFIPLLFCGMTASPFALYVLCTEYLFAMFSSTITKDYTSMSINVYTSVFATAFLLLAFVVKNKVSSDPGKEGTHSTGIMGLPLIGNLSVFMSLSFCLFLCVDVMRSEESSIVVVAPILLMLNRDAVLLRHLNARNRYFPVIAMTSVLLTTFSLHIIINRPDGSESAVGFYQIKNILTLFLTLPAIFFIHPLVTLRGRQSEAVWFMVLPLSILSLVLTDLSHIRILSLLGLLGGAYRLYHAHKQIERGNKLI